MRGRLTQNILPRCGLCDLGNVDAHIEQELSSSNTVKKILKNRQLF